MALGPGTTLGPYEVVAPLGAGGMGEVWRARDTRLGRDVAIKVIPDALASDPKALHRFESEAKAVAALSHPNILSLFDVGEANGVRYAVAELLEGETLRALVAKGPVPLKRALAIAHEIAEGLAAAHEKGIVHRDLKPENVFLTKDGHAKVLDFGLARHEAKFRDPGDTHSPTLSAFTEAGAVMGTVFYMSPEQASGKPVDHRSDQFSLGTVLYEMLAGKRPFGGETAAETLTAIIREEPASLAATAPGVPPQVRWIVDRLLSKKPEDRYDSTRDLRRELEACRAHLGVIGGGALPSRDAETRRRVRLVGFAALLGVALATALAFLYVRYGGSSAAGSREAPAGPPPRIVVLPFENLGSPEDAYFASGITEEITSRLANVHGLGVISRTSAAEYPRKGKTIRQVGADLDVGWVLEGTIRWDRSGGGPGRIRITPQLIRVADDTHVWSDRYDRALGDIFELQTDVASKTVAAIGISLLPAERTGLASVPTKDLDAYDSYLRGLAAAGASQERADIEAAVRHLQAAVDRDPGFLQALERLAYAHLMMYWMRWDRSADRLARAESVVAAAVRTDPESPETHVARAYLLYFGHRDYAGATREFEAALRSRPNDPVVTAGLAFVKRRLGLWAESATMLEDSVKLDPRSASLVFNLAQSLELSGRYAAAEVALRTAASLAPTSGAYLGTLAWLPVLWHGDPRRARALLSEAERVEGLTDDSASVALTSYSVSLAERDFPGALRRLDAEPRDALSSQFFYLPVDLLRAEVHALAGRHGEAVSSAGKAKVLLEKEIARDPGDARFRSALGVTLALQGRGEEAVASARKGVELMPRSTDAWIALSRVADLALVCAMTGRNDQALEHLGTVLAGSGDFTPHVFRLDPRWDPLRKDPRFVALLAKYEVKP